MEFTMLSHWFGWGETAVLQNLLLLLGVALSISALGFVRVVYFVSVGYAFSIVAMIGVMVVQFRTHLTVVSGLQLLLLLAWGLRLGIFLVRREFSESYRRTLANTYGDTDAMPFLQKMLIWIGVSLLYVCMFSPGVFGITAVSTFPVWLIHFFQSIGLVVMAGGLFIETIADKQKSDFKQQAPGQFCNVGLYRYLRYPNYFGEIDVWVGFWLISVPFYNTPFKWIVATIGLVCIVLIMMGSAKRLEASQGERYGHQTTYQTYVSTVPILFPHIPLYTLKNIRVYLE